MAIRLIDNYPSNGSLKDERDEYLRLFELGASRTTTGDVSFTSTTSLKSYNTLGTSYAGQGQNGMMNLLFYGDATTPDNPKLVDYAVTSEDVAKIKAASDVIVATGSGTQILLTLTSVDEYETNSKYTFIAGGSNSGAATTININGLGAKNLYKPNTTTAPNIISGKAYTVWYDGTDFFLQASAEGTAVAGDVLAGTTFSNDSDTGIAGTLTLTGTATTGQVLSGATFYNTNAKSKLTGTIPSKGAQTYTPTTSNQTISSGQYLSGTQTIAGDADLVAGNIKNGVSIFNVNGSYKPAGTTAPSAYSGNTNNYSFGTSVSSGDVSNTINTVLTLPSNTVVFIFYDDEYLEGRTATGINLGSAYVIQSAITHTSTSATGYIYLEDGSGKKMYIYNENEFSMTFKVANFTVVQMANYAVCHRMLFENPEYLEVARYNNNYNFKISDYGFDLKTAVLKVGTSGSGATVNINGTYKAYVES